MKNVKNFPTGVAKLPKILTDLIGLHRYVTMMVYLSDVQEGGYTAFPQLRLAVKPERGMAVFWFNLNSDGTPRPDTIHGACPVLIGTKKIANKWVYYGNQTFMAPCTDGNRSPLDYLM